MPAINAADARIALITRLSTKIFPDCTRHLYLVVLKLSAGRARSHSARLIDYPFQRAYGGQRTLLRMNDDGTLGYLRRTGASAPRILGDPFPGDSDALVRAGLVLANGH